MFFQLLIGYTITNILIVAMCLPLIISLPLLKGQIPVLKKKEIIIKFLIGLPISMVLLLFIDEVDISKNILNNQNINNELREKLVKKRSEENLSNLDLFKIVYQNK